MRNFAARITIKLNKELPQQFQVAAIKAINPEVGKAIADAYIQSLNYHNSTSKDNQLLTYKLDSFVEIVQIT